MTTILVRREGKNMSTKTLPLTEVRDHFTSILRDVSRLYDRCVITKKGKPEAILMSYEEFEGWLETLEIMASPKAARRIKEARTKAKKGEVVTFEDAFGESP
ncbi:type II toxin-antitoxin system Phd/YefM family antitoxin [bacterium]|nr:type II toxin-antitoxin system Phd/YefM family antitoxin [bacterium]MCK4325903.1 type II toxin-antitoxin system Phd/YefM family antitoxin [bacterium]MCK4436931.1 type II toxin-antitoxin system Phd/YefM family antitoxin [bacterium]